MGTRWWMVLTVLLAAGAAACSGSNRGSGASHAAGVSGALVSGANLSSDLVATFQADVRGDWAIVYDPAAPPGCAPGGLAASAGAPPIAARPCRAYVLERQNMMWLLRTMGVPGSVELPANVPLDLGDPTRLTYLGR